LHQNLKIKEDLDFSYLPVDYCDRSFVHSRPISQEAVWFFVLFSLLLVDGVMTYIGISHTSTSYEANILVRRCMDLLGVGAGLILSKMLSIFSLCFLWYYKKEIIWIFSAIKGLVFVYLSFAIIPWAYILTNYLFPLS